jgi:hypothetical protein
MLDPAAEHTGTGRHRRLGGAEAVTNRLLPALGQVPAVRGLDSGHRGAAELEHHRDGLALERGHDGPDPVQWTGQALEAARRRRRAGVGNGERDDHDHHGRHDEQTSYRSRTHETTSTGAQRQHGSLPLKLCPRTGRRAPSLAGHILI